MTITKNSSGNYTIVMSPREGGIMDRIENKHGPGVIKDLLEGYIQTKFQEYKFVEANELKEAYDEAATNTQSQVRNLLGL